MIKVWFDDKHVFIETAQGKTGKLPLDDFPRLKYATDAQRADYTLSAGGVHWLQIDEDLSFDGFFNYVPPLQTEIRAKLGEIPEAISLSYVAKKYFGKSRNWLYQRLNGNLVNGKPASFTPAEHQKFVAALEDISDMIRKTSLSLS